MIVQFRLPDLGEGITEAELVRWLVKVGDTVTQDQEVVEVQTDKAMVELPSPVAGTVLELNVPEGQVVPVETVLLTFDDNAEKSESTVSSPSETVNSSQHPDTKNNPATELVAVSSSSNGTSSTNGASAHVQQHRRILATPVARRMARELGIDISTIKGSGPAGRIRTQDVQALVAQQTTRPKFETAPIPAYESHDALTASATPTLPGEDEPADEERIPLRGLRRRIAENMVLSVNTIPQVTSLVEVDATALMALRKSLLTEAEGQNVKLSYLPFIIKALVHALRLYPYVNATIDNDEIVLKHTYSIGIATATPDGLLVPVLRSADKLTLLEIAREVNRLAEAGRERKLQLQELRGSSFTISNYGSVGGFFTTPIINPGEAGILGLGKIVKRPWVVEDRVEVRPVLPLSFTADHRLIDGELAMRFLNTLVATLENPNLLLLHMR
jgi:pyruvate dehydrogenase E2 component (dihydrolipoamide acetyltransferase)